MSFTEAINTCFQKYINFNGRASRSEYWWFTLLSFGLSFIPVIGWILRLVLLLPSLSVQVRRLHDMNRSAWWLLLLVPPITFVGVFVLLIMSIFPGSPGQNRYGPNPLQKEQAAGGYGYVDPGHPHLATSDYDPPGYASPPPETIEASDAGEERHFCTQCGTQLQPDARFCTVCGTSV